MAVARSGSSNFTAVHAWLVVFVVLWLATTVGLVVMYTNQQQLREDADKARADKAILISAGDNSDATVSALQNYRAANPNQSLVRVMRDEIHALAGRITGDQNHDRAMAEAHLDRMLDLIRNGKGAAAVPNPEQIARTEGAVRIINRLYQWYVAQRAAAMETQDQLAAANTQLEDARKTIAELDTKFRSDLDTLRVQVDDLQKSKNAYELAKQTEIDEFSTRITAGTEQLGQVRADMAKQAETYGAALRAKDDIIQSQLGKIHEVQGPAPQRAQELSLAREPIGRVLRALPGDALVHIDVGERDGVTLGMRFAVYGQDRGIAVEGRGKANIEVVSFGPQTAECRVVTPPAPDDPITEGDVIQNIILARRRDHKQRFVVLGAFDVNYDGKIDPTGAAKIRAYIERFGGEVVPEVDATVDYVVRGRPAAEVAPAEGEAVDHAAGPESREARRRAQTFEEALQRAQLLGIPRLSPEAFYNFVGLEPGPNVATRLLP